jgi:hypothetical protein
MKSETPKIVNSSKSKEIRRKLQEEYRALCRLARDQKTPIKDILLECQKIKCRRIYEKHSANLRPHIFNMKLKTLAMYADSVFRLKVHNIEFFHSLTVTFSTMNDTILYYNSSLSMAGNLAYMALKSKNKQASEWANNMLMRIYYSNPAALAAATTPPTLPVDISSCSTSTFTMGATGTDAPV